MSGAMIARTLELLSLLQTRRSRPGAELAARLGISERTLRRDVERLRDMGYRITAERGISGGYSLEPGGGLPPLLLDDDELVVLAMSLRTVTALGPGQADTTSLSTLAKLERLLPERLRRRVSALQTHTIPPGPEPSPSASPDLIARLALACRDGERVRFTHVDAEGAKNEHSVEPHRLVSTDQGWYLVAREPDQGVWEAFRVGAMDSYFTTGTRFAAHSLSPDRAKEIAEASAVRNARRHQALLRIHAPLDVLRSKVGAWAREATAETSTTTLWPISADHMAELALGIAWIPGEYAFDVLEPSEPRAFLHSLGTRLVRATEGHHRKGGGVKGA